MIDHTSMTAWRLDHAWMHDCAGQPSGTSERSETMTRYRTIGAISGHFPRRAPMTRTLQPTERARVLSAVAEAARRGYDAPHTRTYVIERMACDCPSCPLVLFLDLIGG